MIKLEKEQQLKIVYGSLKEQETGRQEAVNFVREAKENEAQSIAIVADIFRASTTIAYLLDSGVKYVVLRSEDPIIAKKIIEMKSQKREGIYFGIGSDAKGETMFELPNSPSIVDSERSLIKNRIAVMCTSKGTDALLNAKQVGFNDVIVASYSTTNSIINYLKRMCLQNNLCILLVATEGRFSENQTITEDALYVEYLSKILSGKTVDLQEYLDLSTQTQGACRFRKNIPYFPAEDIEAALKPIDYFPFFPIIRKIKDVVVAAKYRSSISK